MKWPTFHLGRSARPVSPPARPYRILYTSGDQLYSPPELRGAFERSLSRSLTTSGEIGDEFVMRAFAASVTAHICTEYKAGKVASIPIKVVDGFGQVLESTPLQHFLSQAPFLFQNWSRSHDIFARTYLRKRYNTSGYPTGLKWLNPLDVYEYTDHQQVIGYRVTNADGTTENVPLNQMIYTQAFDARPGGNGLSNFEAAWLPLNVEQNMTTQAAAFFVNGARIDGFLSSEEGLMPEQEKELKETWAASYKGSGNAHRTAFLPGGVKYNPISAPPKDLAMPELKGIAREDICGVFQVDPILVGLKGAADPLSANSTYGTAETAHIRGVTLPFVETVILPALNEQWALTDFDRRNTYHLEVDTMAIPALVESQLVKSDTAIHLSDGHVLDYAESRDLLGYEPREGYLLRKPDDALALWNASGLSLNALHQMTLGATPLGTAGEVLMVGGQYIPVARLMEVANANADQLIAPPPTPTPSGGTLPPPSSPNGGISVTPPPTPQLPPGRTTDETRSLFVGLHFPNHPDLMGLQQRLKGLFADQQVEWNDSVDFHTTLIYAPDSEDEQVSAFLRALSEIDLPSDLALRIGSLHSFDNVDEHALHFQVRRNADLLDLQEAFYDAARTCQLGLSAFSAPTAYKPHITMGYCAERPRAVTFHSPLTVQPASLRVMRGKLLVYERSFQVPTRAMPTIDTAHAQRFSFDGYELIQPAERFDETQHPRQPNGKFGDKGGGGSATPEQQKELDSRSYQDFSPYPETLVADTFSKNIPTPTPQQVEALDYYRSIEGNASLNRTLRTGGKLSGRDKQQARQLDGLLNQSTLDYDTKVYRGLAPDNPQLKIFKAQLDSGELGIGAVMKDNGYASTTMDSNVAGQTFGANGGVVFAINAPKGTRGLYMNSALDKASGGGGHYESEFRDEREVLLPRETTFRITGISHVGGQYRVEATIDDVIGMRGYFGLSRTQTPPMRLEAAISLADNQFVRYSRRLLSDTLSAAGIEAQWVGEGEWRYGLAAVDQWSPGELSTFLRTVDYAQSPPVDVRITAFQELDGAIYAHVDGSTSALALGIETDLRGVGLAPVAREATAAEGILLCRTDAILNEVVFPPVDFPIVLNNISLYLGDEPYHRWTLRSGSAAQWTELKNWELVTRRKGATHAFRVETLPRWIADTVQVSLYDGEDPDMVFREARALLSQPRAYSGTRDEFQQAVASLIQAANADENSRRAFAAQLRSALRRYGLMAFRDGMEDGGYSPESFNADELATFRAWQAESSGYVTNVGAELFQQGATPDPEFRAELWANKSLDDIYFAGLRIGAPTKEATWRLGSTIDHCRNEGATFGCLERDGQTMTVEAWSKIGLPRSHRLTCGGWRCDCDIFDSNGRRIGAR